MTRESKLMCAIFTVCVAFPASSAAQQCLHGADESADEKGRKRQALTVARQINTLQANRPEARTSGYLDQPEMAAWPASGATKTGAAHPLNFDRAAEVIPGWHLTLNKTDNGYWFMIKDKTDPCGFAFISNQQGLIYTAEPIR